MTSLLKDTKFTRVSAAAAAGQTDVASSILDMAGFDGVLFVALLGDVTDTSVLTLTAQQNTANSTSGMSALTGAATFTAGASDADSKAMILDVIRPVERYVRAVLSRGTANAAVDGILAIQYRAGTKPCTQDASVIASSLITDAVEA